MKAGEGIRALDVQLGNRPGPLAFSTQKPTVFSDLAKCPLFRTTLHRVALLSTVCGSFEQEWPRVVDPRRHFACHRTGSVLKSMHSSPCTLILCLARLPSKPNMRILTPRSNLDDGHRCRAEVRVKPRMQRQSSGAICPANRFVVVTAPNRKTRAFIRRR